MKQWTHYPYPYTGPIQVFKVSRKRKSTLNVKSGQCLRRFWETGQTFPTHKLMLIKMLTSMSLRTQFCLPVQTPLFLNPGGLFQYYRHDIIAPASITDFCTAEWNAPRQFTIMVWAHVHMVTTHARTRARAHTPPPSSYLRKKGFHGMQKTKALHDKLKFYLENSG